MIFLLLMLDAGKIMANERYNFDVVEFNTRIDDAGNHCYDQIILWDWYPDLRRHHVVAWFLVKDSTPTKVGDRWRVRHSFGGKTYDLYAKTYRRTVTVTDPETQDKELFPEKYRRKLTR